MVCFSIPFTCSLPNPPASHLRRSRSKPFITGAASPPPPVVSVPWPRGLPLSPRLRPSHGPGRASGAFRGRCWVSPSRWPAREALQRPVTVGVPCQSRGCRALASVLGEGETEGILSFAGAQGFWPPKPRRRQGCRQRASRRGSELRRRGGEVARGWTGRGVTGRRGGAGQGEVRPADGGKIAWGKDWRADSSGAGSV